MSTVREASKREPSSARGMTYADLPAVARLHLDAFAGSMGAELGPRYAERFLRWFIDAPEAETTVVERDGVVAGYVVGAVEGYATRMNRELLPAIARGVVHNPRVLLHRNFLPQLPVRLATLASRRLGTSHTDGNGAPTGPAAFALVGIGVSPAARGSGVGRELLRGFEHRVWRRAAARVLFLDVYEDNDQARRLYETAGWQVEGQSGRVLIYVRRRPEGA